MNKLQFILALQKRLQDLPEDDLHRSLEYYNEMIDDRMEEGLSEEEAVAAIGSVEELAQQILEDTPMPKLMKAKLQAKKLETWQLVLLIITAPIWLSAVFGIASGLLGTYIGIWAIIVSIFAAAIAVAVSAVAGVLAAIVFCFTGQFTTALFLFGCGLICGGVSIFLFLGGKYAAKGIVWISKKLCLWVKSLFVRKEAVQ